MLEPIQTQPMALDTEQLPWIGFVFDQGMSLNNAFC